MKLLRLIIAIMTIHPASSTYLGNQLPKHDVLAASSYPKKHDDCNCTLKYRMTGILPPGCMDYCIWWSAWAVRLPAWDW